MMKLLEKSEAGLFATRTLSGHLLRGGLALTLLHFAISQQGAHPVGALVAGLAALVAMRGCPACWTIGLIETIQQRRKGRLSAAPTASNPETPSRSSP